MSNKFSLWCPDIMTFFQVVEKNLQKQLRELCDLKGRETNPDQSAVVLNNLGLLYRCKSPDKTSLIQSAALLNAAIVRQPANEKFQNDLKDLCKYVLEFANASDKDADLLQNLNSAATQTEKMRNTVKKRLNTIKKVPNSDDETVTLTRQKTFAKDIQLLQRQIAIDYQSVMAYISRKCIQAIGEPPCNYALVGMGSLAREEITPYSDFEHIVVLQNLENKTEAEIEKCKEYFRWYSVLFHIIVINLKETYIPKVCVPCLNDGLNSPKDWFWDKITPSGISFDSMKPLGSKIPLGRTQHTKQKPWTTELIKPVDEMVKYLDVDEDLKNGYKLGDILTRTCFVEGDERVYQHFSDKVDLMLKMNSAARQSSFLKQLEEDLENFDLYENLIMFVEINDINIKQVIYRSITLFVSALGRLHQINKNSAFDIIEQFFTENIFLDYTSTKMKNAVAVACHLRLVHYMNKKRQQDNIHHEIEFEGKAKLQEMTKVVTTNNLVDALTTALILQVLLQTNADVSELDRMFLYDYTIQQITILNSLGLYNDTIRIGLNSLKNEEMIPKAILYFLFEIGNSCVHLASYSKYFEICKKYQSLIEHSQDPSLSYFQNRIKLNQVQCFFGLTNYLTALKKSDALLKTKLEIVTRVEVWNINGVSKFFLSQFRSSLRSFREVQKYWKSIESTNKRMDLYSTYFFISLSLIKIDREEQGLHLAREGLNLIEIFGASSKYSELLATIIKNYTPHIEQDTDCSGRH